MTLTFSRENMGSEWNELTETCKLSFYANLYYYRLGFEYHTCFNGFVLELMVYYQDNAIDMSTGWESVHTPFYKFNL